MISDDGDRYSANLVVRNFNLVFHNFETCLVPYLFIWSTLLILLDSPVFPATWTNQNSVLFLRPGYAQVRSQGP